MERRRRVERERVREVRRAWGWSESSARLILRWEDERARASLVAEGCPVLARVLYGELE